MISVLMTTFDGEAFVREAVASVLGQREVDLELVITDDGSSDRTPAIVRALADADDRASFVVHPHTGMAGARNACLRRARGSHIALLDQDDRYPQGKLARQLALLQSPRAGAVFGLTQLFEGEELREPVYTMLLAAGLMRREVFDELGGFDLGYTTADDLDFLLRLLESDRSIELEAGLGVHHRRHPRQATADLDATRRECVRALARSLQRRRESGIHGALNHPLIAHAARPLR